MSNLVRLTTIEVAQFQPPGTRRVLAWRLGDWAAYQPGSVPGLWSLVLLPLGLTLPPDWASFRSARQACAAMAEIVRLRNSWSVIMQEDLTPVLREQLRAIVRKYGAVDGGYSCGAVKADASRFGMRRPRRLNRYGVS